MFWMLESVRQWSLIDKPFLYIKRTMKLKYADDFAYVIDTIASNTLLLQCKRAQKRFFLNRKCKKKCSHGKSFAILKIWLGFCKVQIVYRQNKELSVCTCMKIPQLFTSQIILITNLVPCTLALQMDEIIKCRLITFSKSGTDHSVFLIKQLMASKSKMFTLVEHQVRVAAQLYYTSRRRLNVQH